MAFVFRVWTRKCASHLVHENPTAHKNTRVMENKTRPKRLGANLTPELSVPSPAEEDSVMVQTCPFPGREQVYFLPNEHRSNPNVHLSPSLLLEGPHYYLFSLGFADLCGNLVWKSPGHVATQRSERETAPGRLVQTHHVGH